MFIPDPSAETVKIPVQVDEEGHLKQEDGDPLPSLKEGCHGTLTVKARSFEERKEVRKFTEEEWEIVLPSTFSIWMHLRTDRAEGEIEDEEQEQLDYTRPPEDPPKPGSMIEVQLRDHLWLQHRGTKHARFSDCTCGIPVLPDLEPESLNQVYTRLSEVYEPHRSTHTGNVYEKAYLYVPEKGDPIQPEKHGWLKLKALREGTAPSFQTSPHPRYRPWWVNPDGNINSALATLHTYWGVEKDGGHQNRIDAVENEYQEKVWKADIWWVPLTGEDPTEGPTSLRRNEALDELTRNGYEPLDSWEHDLDIFEPPLIPEGALSK